MDTSGQSAGSISDEFDDSLQVQQESDVEEAEPHIHMPNPSFWPILLSLSIAVTLGGVLVVASAPWISLVALPFVLICMLGWALENPMAPKKEEPVVYQARERPVVAYPAYAAYQVVEAVPSKFQIGQNVVDARGKWLGKVQARFSRYILVERGTFLPKVYYVPQSATRDQIKNNTVFLTLSEEDLVRQGLNSIPDDLYEEVPEAGIPRVRGVPQFARRPLSPAETGHYNYGRMSPGINTDASGSYHREEVQPRPQTYVTDNIYTTDEPIPSRVISPD